MNYQKFIKKINSIENSLQLVDDDIRISQNRFEVSKREREKLLSQKDLIVEIYKKDGGEFNVGDRVVYKGSDVIINNKIFNLETYKFMYGIVNEECHGIVGGISEDDPELKPKSKNINKYTHIILYAKNWYKITDVINDLKIIIGKVFLLDPEHIDINSIATCLLEMVINQILSIPIKNDFDKDNAFRAITNIVWDLHPNNRWKVGGNDEESLEMGIIRKCLSVIKLTSVKDMDTIGKPDPCILPLREN